MLDSRKDKNVLGNRIVRCYYVLHTTRSDEAKSAEEGEPTTSKRPASHTTAASYASLTNDFAKPPKKKTAPRSVSSKSKFDSNLRLVRFRK